MIKEIVKDVIFLGQKSEPAAREDLYIARDLQDTLQANRANCVGMAANMIGYHKKYNYRCNKLCGHCYDKPCNKKEIKALQN